MRSLRFNIHKITYHLAFIAILVSSHISIMNKPNTENNEIQFDLFCLHWSSSASSGHAAGGASQMQGKWIKLDLESNNEEGIL